MKLNSIVSSVQFICEAIASVVHIDVTIVNDELVRLAGTGRYKQTIGDVVGERSAFQYALSEGVAFVIENPGAHQACLACDCKSTCTEHAEMCCPILLGGEVIGVIGLIAFKEDQRKRLISQQDDLMVFINRMAELIASKLEAQEAMDHVERIKNELQAVVETVEAGFMTIDPQGHVTQLNGKMKKMLGKGSFEHVSQILSQEEITYILGVREGVKNLSLQLPRGQKVVSDVSVIKVQGLIQGYVLTVKPLDEFIKTVNEFTLDTLHMAFEDILGQSKAMRQAKNTAMTVASKPSNVLILGESGTGKELFARAIHSNSTRANGPFIAINCAAIPDGLLESELFGYEEGAFTGARLGGKPGKFQLASGGTLFLDEIGDMALHLQAKLLRALQENVIEPVGGKGVVRVDVRVIAATHQHLEEKVSEGSFRRDLFYRLNVIPVHIPPLRDRIEDLEDLLPAIIEKNNVKLSKHVKGVSLYTKQLLEQHLWPGNVRELENVIEYAMNMCEGDVIDQEHLPKRLEQKERGTMPLTQGIIPLERIEEGAIKNALVYFRGDKQAVEKAAKALGIGRATLYRRMKYFGLKENGY